MDSAKQRLARQLDLRLNTTPIDNTRALLPPLDELASIHNTTLAHTSSRSFREAYDSSTRCLALFLKHYQSTEGNADNVLLKAICHTHYLLSKAATAREDFARQLMKCFSITVNDRSPLAQSKRWATVYIAILLIRTYLGIGNVRLCDYLVRALEEGEFPPLHLLSKAESTTYRYFRGRICVGHRQYKQAEEHLAAAYADCPPGDHSHRRMVRGKFPSSTLLQHYALPEFDLIRHAIKEGRIDVFASIIDQHMAFFIKHGLFMLFSLELQGMVNRAFIRRVHGAVQSADPSRLSINDLRIAYSIMMPGQEVAVKELECIVANLIYNVAQCVLLHLGLNQGIHSQR